MNERVEFCGREPRPNSGVPHPDEHSAIRWVSRDELEDLEWAEADVPVLPQVADLLSDRSRYSRL